MAKVVEFLQRLERPRRGLMRVPDEVASMLCGVAFLALSYVHHHGGDITDWTTQIAVSSLIHAVVCGLALRLMHHLTLDQDAVLVIVMLGALYLCARSHDQRGW